MPVMSAGRLVQKLAMSEQVGKIQDRAIWKLECLYKKGISSSQAFGDWKLLGSGGAPNR